MKWIQLVICFFITLGASAQLTLQDSLVAHYRLDGNANDASGNGYNGANNGATPTTDRFGWPNSAMEFDGTSSWMTTNSTFDFPERTISLWLYPTASNGSGNNSHGALVQDANTLTYGHVFVSLGDGVLRMKAGGEAATHVVGAATLSQWQHVVVVRTATATSYYHNGVLSGTSTSGTVGSASYPNTTCVIGTGRRTTDQFYKGKIDEIMIYNRAFTAAEVDTLYNLSTTGISAKSQLDTEWNLLANPVVGSNLKIKFNKSVTGVFAMVDGVGREVKKIDVKASKGEVINVSTNGLSNGTYFIRNTSNQFAAKKVILIK